MGKSTNSKAWFCGEPSVEELLADPIVRLVMARDGLTPDAVLGHLQSAARRLRSPEKRAA